MITTRKQFLILLAVAVLINAGACRRRTANQNANQETVNSNVASPEETPVGGLTSTGQRFYFRGTIGGNLRIEVTLLRDGDRITGTYFYPKVGKNIEINGTIDKSSSVDLREKDDSGKETGVFKGKWKDAAAPTELGMANLSGKWSKPDGSKETNFELTQQPVSFSAEAFRISPKLIRETNKQSHYAIDVEYPQIEGDVRFDKFNREARALITKEVAAFKSSAMASGSESESETTSEAQNSTLDCTYEIRLATDDLISVEFSESEYSQGAAHPNSFATVLNYDVKNGKKLALADLFNPKSNYLKTISDYCIKDLKQQSKTEGDALPDDMIQSGASPRADNFKGWTVTKNGLWINFDPYQVGPYVAGPQRVLIPYSALKDLIKPDGPIGEIAK
jgi:Protein of unknown function (DUF3298)/Deacetylase PdaC